MERKSFESLINEKLGNHELPVNPKLWKNVSTQAGLSTGSAGLGLGSLLGIASAIVTLTFGLYYFSNREEAPLKTEAPRTSQKPTNKQPEIVSPKPLSSKEENTHINDLNISPNVTSVIGLETMGIDDEPTLIFAPGQESKIMTSDQMLTEKGSVITTHQPYTATLSNVSTPHQTEIMPQSEVSVSKKTVVMPNAITPNGDGVNDELSIDAEGLSDFNVVILDATNRLVFSSSDPKFSWNGYLMNGDPAPSGTYQYYFTAKDAQGTWCNQFSSLTVIR